MPSYSTGSLVGFQPYRGPVSLRSDDERDHLGVIATSRGEWNGTLSQNCLNTDSALSFLRLNSLLLAAAWARLRREPFAVSANCRHFTALNRVALYCILFYINLIELSYNVQLNSSFHFMW